MRHHRINCAANALLTIGYFPLFQQYKENWIPWVTNIKYIDVMPLIDIYYNTTVHRAARWVAPNPPRREPSNPAII